jgi:hypothetical protein
MASGEQQISRLGDVEFRGKVGENVTTYAKRLQRLSHAFGAQLTNDAQDAERAMRRLSGRHPLLKGMELRFRARRVSRRLRRASELFVGLGAEAVKFQAEYKKQFHNVEGEQEKRPKSGEVDL